jgi:hypothetical protein
MTFELGHVMTNRAVIGTVCGVLLMAACTNESTNPRSGTVSLRVVHGVSWASNIRIDMSGVAVGTSIAYKESTGYVSAAASGTLEVKYAISGTVLLSQDMDLAVDDAFTVVVIGSPGDMMLGVAADTAFIPATGQVKLRVIHSASELPDVDILLTQPGVGSPFRLLFPFQLGTVSQYQQGDPGRYIVELREPGTLAELGSVAIDLNQGQVRTVIVLDGAGGSPDFLVLDDRA